MYNHFEAKKKKKKGHYAFECYYSKTNQVLKNAILKERRRFIFVVSTYKEDIIVRLVVLRHQS